MYHNDLSQAFANKAVTFLNVKGGKTLLSVFLFKRLSDQLDV